MALKALDSLISQVEKLPSASGLSAATARRDITNIVDDVAFWPSVPHGHTAYSWIGQGSETAHVAPSSAPAVPAQAESKTSAPGKHQPAAKQGAQLKKEKKGGAKQVSDKADSKDAPSGSPFERLDLRVGRVIKAWKHPDADSLYVEEIDIGEAQPRQVVSGLFKFVPLEEFEGSDVIVVANLKAAKMRGVSSFGMVLATSNADHTVVQLVRPPAGSKPGERVQLEGETLGGQPDKDVDGKKATSAWALARPDLRTNAQGIATYKGKAMVTSAGPCASKLVDSQIS